MTDHLLTKKEARKQAMIVRTFLEERPIVTTKAPQLTAKKTTASTVVKKQLPTPQNKSNTASMNSAVFKELAKSLENLTTPQKPKNTSLSLPKPIFLKTEIEHTIIQNKSYAENVIEYLTQNLDLPEFGAVKMLLKINSSGSVMNCEVLEEKSRKNSEFLKNRLPKLTFPCFNDFGLSDSQLELIITFQNLRS